jgi:cytochrome c oxidase subunit 2
VARVVGGGSRWARGAAVALAVVALPTGTLLAACGEDGGSDAAPEVALSPAGERGRAVAETNGCRACHSIDGARSMGPTWQGLAGSEVELDGGRTVVADAAYLEQSIRDPRSQVRAGFDNLMPVAYGDLTDDEVADLIAYLTDLAAAPDA